MLDNCLRSVSQALGGRSDAEIIVVEAADGAKIPLPVEAAHLLVPEREAGFSGQRNIGVAASSAEFIVFVDDDVEAASGWLDALTAPVLGDQSALGAMGAVFPKIENAVSFVTGVLGHPGGGFRLHASSGGRIVPLSQVATCNTVFRRSAVMSVGGFDENMKFGAEDSEFCVRITTLDGKNRFRYIPSAVVYHYSKDDIFAAAKWYFRRGRADAELLRAHREHAGYFLRSSLMFKLAVASAASVVVGDIRVFSWFLAVWYAAQLLRGRFMWNYFHLYNFGFLRRLGIYVIFPFIKLVADCSFDSGRIVGLCSKKKNA